MYNRCKEEARQGFICKLDSPGGWPLHTIVRNGRREYRHFGLPPLPIMMWWSLQKSPVHYLSFEAFKLNTGKLPQLVLVQLRKFLTFDVDSDMSLQLQVCVSRGSPDDQGVAADPRRRTASCSPTASP